LLIELRSKPILFGLQPLELKPAEYLRPANGTVEPAVQSYKFNTSTVQQTQKDQSPQNNMFK
jgi:hypothetical protein